MTSTPNDLTAQLRRRLEADHQQIDGERFVVLPAGTLDAPPWTVGGRPP